MNKPFTPDRQKQLIEMIQALPTVTPCAECDFFDAQTSGGYCGKWNTNVPAEAQAAGCDEWVQLIPF